MNNQKEWLSMKEAQQLLDITSRNGVYKFCKLHKVRVTKPCGGRVYFNRSDLMNGFSSVAVVMGI